MSEEKEDLARWVSLYFTKLRFHKDSRLGFGDIRLTVEQQNEIINRIRDEEAERDTD